jgi:hypothetical protein
VFLASRLPFQNHCLTLCNTFATVSLL